MDESDRGWSLAFDLGQQRQEVFLALPRSTDADDVSASSVEGSEQLESTTPSIFVFHSHGSIGTGRTGGKLSGTRL